MQNTNKSCTLCERTDFKLSKMFKLFNNMTINHNVNNLRQLAHRENALTIVPL